MIVRSWLRRGPRRESSLRGNSSMKQLVNPLDCETHFAPVTDIPVGITRDCGEPGRPWARRLGPGSDAGKCRENGGRVWICGMKRGPGTRASGFCPPAALDARGRPGPHRPSVPWSWSVGDGGGGDGRAFTADKEGAALQGAFQSRWREGAGEFILHLCSEGTLTGCGV